MTERTVAIGTLAAVLRAAGARPGTDVLVHSSYKALGAPIEGGPAGVVEALVQAVGESGTVLFPTITGAAWMDRDHPPEFDVRTTPCWTGAIPEAARARPDARRSLHPTHSVVAFGARAAAYSDGHDLSPTPCGPDSPYGRLVTRGGHVLFLGATLESCTLFHAFEELAGVPYHLQVEPVAARVIDETGIAREVTLRLHWWNDAAPRCFDNMALALRAAGALVDGQVLAAPTMLLDAARAHAIVMPLLRADSGILLRR